MLSFCLSLAPVLAQQNDDQAAAAAGMAIFGLFGAIFCGAFLIMIAIQVVICWILSSCLKAIPPEHRQQQPNMVWLLLIPLFNIVWNFFVHPKIADSYKSYFNSIGRTDVGDCGRGLALAYCIMVCCLLIPYLNACVGIGALVVLIILLVKFSGYKNQIVSGTQAITPPAQPPAP